MSPIEQTAWTPTGLMRRRVALQTLSETVDAFGEKIPTWNVVNTFWARVKPLVGMETTVAGQLRAALKHEVTIRWPGASFSINPEDQLLYEGRTLKIESVMNLEERNRELRLTCIEVQTP